MPSELEAARDAVRLAIAREGRSPEWHHATMARHRVEWPTLWEAIDRLLAVPTEHEVRESYFPSEALWAAAAERPVSDA